jgi:hypothetical protein
MTRAPDATATSIARVINSLDKGHACVEQVAGRVTFKETSVAS